MSRIKMTNDQEHNLRLMLSKLAEAEKGKLALSLFTPELETLFNSVDLADPHWREGFWDSWGDLEISYAFALDMGWKSLDDVREQIVVQAVADLRSLISAKLQHG